MNRAAISSISHDDVLTLLRQGAGLASHSGKVQAGDVFVALPSLRGSVDGAAFAAQVAAAGAVCLVAAQDARLPDDLPIPVLRTADPRAMLGELAGVRFGTQRLGFPLIGITGTNGKTSICAMLEHLFQAAGKAVGVLGTVSYRWPGVDRAASLTTPGCLELHGMLREMQDAGVEIAFMEVASHALDQQRVAGLAFDGAALTNITQDHLDYHADMEDYARTKFRLFLHTPRQDKPVALNADDAYGARLLTRLPQSVGFGLHPLVELPEDRLLQGRILEHSISGLTLECAFRGQRWILRSPMVGAHNASNLLAAMAMALQCGLSVDDLQALESFAGVCGRLERVPNARGRHVFVDYAHTPDALENVLKALDMLRRGRLLVVFGCGGNRDRGKRPLMGRAVCRYADVAVLTSDNPRREDPDAIMDDVMPGLAHCKRILRLADRREAIAAALESMDEADICIIAGKGHEDYQIIGDTKFPFSDQQVVRDVLGSVPPCA
ncbi:UDP-N-acetylmuramoyl-L-alanyl-D-glutamate--2,6-diaminopimelate ligase [Megalodesulfovibrio gigas]|uniref:UDP-N-acetylmuramoyl-L-alanyl-D-glutamate--2,6-diaminopimelate ligase n=1 Tax=Megalodesulfovibrio gigas (strain ATCC 19364 / DSM 1382 / NCIMB 9332 / VKM B-1759) TaxID=1121448 RepID=T2G7K7_MEGG1|nr:UDP-N-acetylmuramoyl-L-alanyl-D-glutamate--2,6-diaminopimelate ligase [Megalodesulfovibrio gigas]AGW12273.1 putative UDP-N-acetylmuramoyl-L-alanyl-D-glutamate--2, 6-diaminopimelate ligase [Megalodesulfovibrio gigas DSM 1382 = ATCC 19364]